MIVSNTQLTEIASVLTRGELVVLPTDTIYGIVASATNPQALQKLIAAKQRSPHKPFITLIHRVEDLTLFGIQLSSAQAAALNQLWPGQVSVVIGMAAFRLPALPWLRDLITLTGPLAAPSANPEGEPPATTIEHARAYFGERVSYYLDGGLVTGKASTLLKLEADGSTTTLRV